MTTKDKPFVHQVNVKWIKAKSGTRMICVDESMNPQS